MGNMSPESTAPTLMAEEQPCQEHWLKKIEKDGQEHSNVVQYKRHCGSEALYIRG